MKNFAEDTRDGLKAINTIMAGVFFLFSLAAVIGNGLSEGAAGLRLFFPLSVIFGAAAFGLAKKSRWAVPLTLALNAVFVTYAFVSSDPKALWIFGLMILTAPFAIYLEIAQLRTWLISTRRQA